jgi:hypothetical protein
MLKRNETVLLILFQADGRGTDLTLPRPCFSLAPGAALRYGETNRKTQHKYLSTVERDAFLRAAEASLREVRTLCGTLAHTGCRISKALVLTSDLVGDTGGVLGFETAENRKRGVIAVGRFLRSYSISSTWCTTSGARSVGRTPGVVYFFGIGRALPAGAALPGSRRLRVLPARTPLPRGWGTWAPMAGDRAIWRAAALSQSENVHAREPRAILRRHKKRLVANNLRERCFPATVELP